MERLIAHVPGCRLHEPMMPSYHYGCGFNRGGLTLPEAWQIF